MKAKPEPPRYLLCVSTAYQVSLEARKVYRVVPDATAEARGMVRVIDESGEDYLYPRELFVPVELPAAAVVALAGGEAA